MFGPLDHFLLGLREVCEGQRVIEAQAHFQSVAGQVSEQDFLAAASRSGCVLIDAVTAEGWEAFRSSYLTGGAWMLHLQGGVILERAYAVAIATGYPDGAKGSVLLECLKQTTVGEQLEWDMGLFFKLASRLTGQSTAQVDIAVQVAAQLQNDYWRLFMEKAGNETAQPLGYGLHGQSFGANQHDYAAADRANHRRRSGTNDRRPGY